MTIHRRTLLRPPVAVGARPTAWVSLGRRLRRRQWVLVAAVVPTVVAAMVAAALRDEVYRAEVVISVGPSIVEALLDPDLAATPDEPLDAFEPFDPFESTALDAEITHLEGDLVRNQVETALGLGDVPVARVLAVGPQTLLLRVDAASPELAELVADTYADAYVASRTATRTRDIADAGIRLQRWIVELEEQLVALDTTSATDATDQTAVAERRALEARRDSLVALDERLRAVEAVGRPAAQIESDADATERRPPGVARTLLASLAAGAMLGLLAVGVAELLDNVVRDPADVGRADPAARVLGSIPEDPSAWSGAARLQRSRDPASVAVRVVANQVLGRSGPAQVIQVAAVDRGDGATSVASSLAVVLAERGRDVVVVDLDLRSPGQHRAFGVDGSLGVVDVIGGDVLDLALLPIGPHLQLLPSGVVPDDPMPLLADGGAHQLLQQLRTRFDTIVVDSPAVGVADDAAIVSAGVDALVLVVSAGTTPIAALRRALTRLADLGAAPDGVVVNRAVLRRTIGRRPVDPRPRRG